MTDKTTTEQIADETEEQGEQCPGLDFNIWFTYWFQFNAVQRTCDICLDDNLGQGRGGRRNQRDCERVSDFLVGVQDDFSNCMLNVCRYDCTVDKLVLSPNAGDEFFCGCEIFECRTFAAAANDYKKYNALVIIALFALINLFFVI